MKITQEVREFARLHPLLTPGDDASPSAGEGAQSGVTAEAGMAEMSKRFHEEGGELYVPATE